MQCFIGRIVKLFIIFAFQEKTFNMKYHINLLLAGITLIILGTAPILATDKISLSSEEKAQLYVLQLGQSLAMPDLADYSEDFYYRNYLTSVTARKAMPWGATIPSRVFKHFVLPVRVNNENLDSARWVFYDELKDRVKHFSMKDAILEVNHWCHEKVSYRPSDARTSSPLATVKTAYGRCGEESTLLVAALRSVCIPARQVYTPRWAHTDDNHAWVEAWADGQWYFLGACEPEPVLNLGWFNEGASRAMLMHTKVAGDYQGPEEVISRTPCYTEINVTSNYAPTCNVEIVVVDSNNAPVQGAKVEFKLYNYAEFYTLVTRTTGSDGKVSLSAGRGDLLVWVKKDNLVAVKKVSWREPHSETIMLNSKRLPEHLDLDIVPPAPHPIIPTVTTEQRVINDLRKAQEDSIRQAYEATMPVEAWRGNHRVIQQFINEAKNKVMANKLLEVISDKDLRDISLDVLRDNEVTLTDTSDIYCRYVLNPRVENEWLTPYKSFFAKELHHIKNIGQLIEWTRNNIIIDGNRNPQHLRQQPMSVFHTRQADELGRAIFFVSAARSLGWPARINEVNGKLEYYRNNTWHEVRFEEQESLKIEPTGTLRLKFTPSGTHNDLAYYTHFTLSKIVDNKPQLLTYPEDATWSKSFKNGVELEPGTYLLTTGNRQSDGSVLASTTTFTIVSGQEQTVALKLRESQDALAVVGNIDCNQTYQELTPGDNQFRIISQEGYTIVGIIASNHEPTNHAMHDIATCIKELEAYGCHLVIIDSNGDGFLKYKTRDFSNSKWLIELDQNKALATTIGNQLNIDTTTLPVFLLSDSNGNVYFTKQGYTIHMGQQLLNVAKRLRQQTR